MTDSNKRLTYPQIAYILNISDIEDFISFHDAFFEEFYNQDHTFDIESALNDYSDIARRIAAENEIEIPEDLDE